MAQDWTGNKRSTFSTLGASNHSDYERAESDFYATAPRAIDALFAKEEFAPKIWECACGEGHLSKRMVELGKEVISTDLVDRGYGELMDFLQQGVGFNADIITNPPYKYAQEFVEKAIELTAGKVAMFLKITFLEGQKRRKLFEKYPPSKVYVFSARIQVARNGEEEMWKKSSAACYAWFIWEKGYEGPPIIKWI